MAEARASVAKHPIHPMLVVIPLGLWTAALAFDIVAAVTTNTMWRTIAFWNIVGGIIGALRPLRAPLGMWVFDSDRSARSRRIVA